MSCGTPCHPASDGEVCAPCTYRKVIVLRDYLELDVTPPMLTSANWGNTPKIDVKYPRNDLKYPYFGLLDPQKTNKSLYRYGRRHVSPTGHSGKVARGHVHRR